MHKVFEHNPWQNRSQFFDKKDLIFHDVKHCYVICLKIVGTFLTCLMELLLEVEATVCSTIKEDLLPYCRKFLSFDILAII